MIRSEMIGGKEKPYRIGFILYEISKGNLII